MQFFVAVVVVTVILPIDRGMAEDHGDITTAKAVLRTLLYSLN